VEDARRYASLREDEIADVERKNRQDRKNFELNDELQRKWQDLDVQLSRAGYGIKKTFIEGLEGLVTPLNNLSDSFSNAVASFLSSDQIKTWIDNFGKSIDDFSGYLKTNQFKENVKDWLSMLGELKDSLSGLIVLLKPLQVLAPTNIEKGQEAVAKGDWWTASKKLPATDFISAVTKNIFGGKTEYKGTEATGIIPSEKLTNQQISENQKRAMQIWTEAGFQKHQVAGIAGNIQQESGFNPNAINLEGGKVHYGIGQWDAERQKDFEKLYGHKMQDKVFDQLKEQSEFLLYELKNKEYKAGKALERSKTVEEATNAILGFERPSRDPEILAKELSTRLGYATKIGGISAQAEAKQKLESENTQSPMNKSSYTSATTSSDNKYSSLGWNSSPVTLNINTIQPPGQVTNVNARQIGNWGAIR
jgi:hypothetical protein